MVYLATVIYLLASYLWATLSIQAPASNELRDCQIGISGILKGITPFPFGLSFKQANHINEEIFSLKVRMTDHAGWDYYVLKPLVRNKASFLKGENQKWVTITSLWQPRHFKTFRHPPPRLPHDYKATEHSANTGASPEPYIILGPGKNMKLSPHVQHHRLSGWRERPVHSLLPDKANGVGCNQKETSLLWATETSDREWPHMG